MRLGIEKRAKIFAAASFHIAQIQFSGTFLITCEELRAMIANYETDLLLFVLSSSFLFLFTFVHNEKANRNIPYIRN